MNWSLMSVLEKVEAATSERHYEVFNMLDSTDALLVASGAVLGNGQAFRFQERVPLFFAVSHGAREHLFQAWLHRVQRRVAGLRALARAGEPAAAAEAGGELRAELEPGSLGPARTEGEVPGVFIPRSDPEDAS